MISDYLGYNFSGKCLKKTIAKTIRMIKSSNIKFDAIAFTGISGALVAPSVATELEKQLIVVRKSLKYCHSMCMIEGCSKKNCRYIIIDDGISHGDTIKNILKELDKTRNQPDLKYKNFSIAKCVGVFLYGQDGEINRLKPILKKWKENGLDFPVIYK